MSIQGLIQALGRDNLCTYFVLPLLRISKVSFITSNFINSYISTDKRHIIVKVYDVTLMSRLLFTHAGYVEMYKVDGYFYLVYKIGRRRWKDVELFCEGKFSHMSEGSKELIRSWSSLDYQRKEDHSNKLITDGRLLALYKHKSLKKMWENSLEVTLDDDDELLEKPGEHTFIDLIDLKQKAQP